MAVRSRSRNGGSHRTNSASNGFRAGGFAASPSPASRRAQLPASAHGVKAHASALTALTSAANRRRPACRRGHGCCSNEEFVLLQGFQQRQEAACLHARCNGLCNRLRGGAGGHQAGSQHRCGQAIDSWRCLAIPASATGGVPREQHVLLLMQGQSSFCLSHGRGCRTHERCVSSRAAEHKPCMRVKAATAAEQPSSHVMSSRSSTQTANTRPGSSAVPQNALSDQRDAAMAARTDHAHVLYTATQWAGKITYNATTVGNDAAHVLSAAAQWQQHSTLTLQSGCSRPSQEVLCAHKEKRKILADALLRRDAEQLLLAGRIAVQDVPQDCGSTGHGQWLCALQGADQRAARATCAVAEAGHQYMATTDAGLAGVSL